MPEKRRRSSVAPVDHRPSFARPPGARPAQPIPSPPRPSRARDISDPSSGEDSFEELEQRRKGLPPKKKPKEKAKSSPAVSPVKKHASAHLPDRERERRPDREKHKRKTSEPPLSYDPADRHRDFAKYSSGTSTNTASKPLSLNALSKLNQENDLAEFDAKRAARKKREKQHDQLRAAEATQKKRRHKNRDVSGAIAEEGRSGEKRRRKGGGSGDTDGYAYYNDHDEKRAAREKHVPVLKKKKWWFIGVAAVVLLIIIIAVAVAANKKKASGGSGGDPSTSGSTSTPKNDCDSGGAPADAKGTYLDITTWLDTSDFNCTYTSDEVGGLSVMGLNSDWDDSASANGNTPALNKPWQYGKMPVRGTNIGGWLNLEPFITPSLFNYAASDNIVDEWTLCQKLGSNAVRMMENHYATFITKADFKAIKDAGLDHVRIPFGYWAVKTYSGEPYVESVSWRYLLRAIEWCRQYGLRVNLDLHAVPGSQNGWAHSGHQGTINWLNGPNGDENGQRSLDIHDQLSKFFAQDRYKNVVAIYGLVNEPKMIFMDQPSRVIDWNQKAISLVRGNGITQQIVFGDGFLALTDWQNSMKNVDKNLMLDTHQYQIFNVGQLKLSHADKINLACSGWTGIMTSSNNPSTGWGPTINGEWSQADTDCTPNLNNVGAGSRWAGNLNTDSGAGAVQVNTPSCASPPCSCAMANASPDQYSSSYKKFLKMYAEAQMHSFEQAQGWFYWTWKTESATQWSWKLGVEAGILPATAYQPDFKCDSDVPDFADLPDSY